ncbi:MAG: DEAD/DEAH box helicase [Bacteriovoracaceae bacterium]
MSSLKAIAALGFESATEIQAKSIPVLLEKDTDFIGQAQTGTGKTAAYLLPLLEKLAKNKDDKALVLAPTRELAIQIQDELLKFTKFEKVSNVCIYGGTSIGLQIKSIRQSKPRIFVGTPGRVLDLLERKVLNLKDVKWMVLDEADEMLDMGFFEDVQTILSHSEDKKIWMFSATMPPQILNLIKIHFCDPEMVKVKKKTLTGENVEQHFYLVKEGLQVEALSALLDYLDDVFGLVFCQTKLDCKYLSDELNARGYPSDALHGDLSQEQRELIFKKLKQKKIKLLTCTDVAARGIDVDGLSHVFNFSLPQDMESYVHRIGRTGRAGKKGVAISIISPREMMKLRKIEKINHSPIELKKLPNHDDIFEKIIEKKYNDINSELETWKKYDENEHFLKFNRKFHHILKDDLLKFIYDDMLERGLRRYLKKVNIEQEVRTNSFGNNDRSGGHGRQQHGGGGRGGDSDRFFINAGSRDGLNTGKLISFISNELNISGKEIGRIDVKNEFSFFEVKSNFTEDILSLKGFNFLNKKINIELSKPKQFRN